MKDRKVNMGSSEHIKIANEKFDDMFNRMLELMSEARSIEFKIKLATELEETEKVFRELDFPKYMSSNYKYPNKKLHKQIADLLAKEPRDKMIQIRLIADNLAHASYLEAQKNIKIFHEKFQIKAILSDKKIGSYYLSNVKDDDGRIVDYAYQLGPDENNLIPESFEVFEKQGYLKAWKEISDIANSILEKYIRNWGYRYQIIQTSRAYKRGEKIIKKEG